MNLFLQARTPAEDLDSPPVKLDQSMMHNFMSVLPLKVTLYTYTLCRYTVDYHNGKQKTHQLITLCFLQLKLYFIKKKHTHWSEITSCHYLQFFITYFFKFNFALWALPGSHDKAVPKYQSKYSFKLYFN